MCETETETIFRVRDQTSRDRVRDRDLVAGLETNFLETETRLLETETESETTILETETETGSIPEQRLKIDTFLGILGVNLIHFWGFWG